MRFGDESETIIIGKPVCLRMVKPNWLTSGGRLGCAWAIRFCTLTWSMFGTVSTSNVTVSVIVPSLALVDCM